MRAGSWRRSRRSLTSERSASTARCMTCRIWWLRVEPWRRSGKEALMDRSFSNQLDVPEDHAAIREGVSAVVTRFDDEYWLARDEDGEFPREFHRAMADAGWLRITMPEEDGGAGLRATQAARMVPEGASHGRGRTPGSAGSIHLL